MLFSVGVPRQPTRWLHSDGKYVRSFPGDGSKLNRNGHRFSVQNFFIDHAQSMTDSAMDSDPVRLASGAD